MVSLRFSQDISLKYPFTFYVTLFIRLKIILLLVLNLSILLVLWYYYYMVLTKLTSNLLESIFVSDILV